jgi:hypothetical protein
MSSQDGVTIPHAPDGDECANQVATAENYCAQQLKQTNTNTCSGETIFVRTDCDNRAPLPLEQQDPIYQKPGVPLDRGKYQAFADAWGGNYLTTTTSSSELWCAKDGQMPTFSDCAAAMANLLANPGSIVPPGKKDDIWQGGVSGVSHICFKNVH